MPQDIGQFGFRIEINLPVVTRLFNKLFDSVREQLGISRDSGASREACSKEK
jgi:hypothetical protein